MQTVADPHQLRTDDADVPEHWVPAVRVDVGRLRKAEKTPSGGIRVPGAVSRTGVLTYRLDDGSVRRELVLPEELSRADALASLRDAPVTVGHPDGGTRLVTSETYKQDAVGHVSGEARVEADHLVSSLAVQDADAIRRIDAGELAELSAGYRVMLDMTPGETADGQRYDAIQRRRVYNHVALLPQGGGRAGGSVSLRLDGEDVEVATEVPDGTPPKKTKPAPAAPSQPQARADMAEPKRVIRVDDVEYELDSDTGKQVVEKKLQERADKIGELEKERDTLQGKHDELKAEHDKLKARVDGIDAEIEERAEERAKLRADAAKVLGEDNVPKKPAEGKSLERTIREAVVKKDDADADLAEKSDDYVEARYDAAIKRASEQTPITRTRGDGFTPAPSNGGGSPHNRGRTPPPSVGNRYQRQR